MSAPQVDRNALVEAAARILVDQGLEAVSLRNVARAVGVKAPSLYWHVKDKRDLLGHLLEKISRETFEEVPEEGDWQQWLRSLAVTVWQRQQRTRDMQQLILQARMRPEVLLEFADYAVGQLVHRGIDPAIAYDAQRSALTLATGWVMIPSEVGSRADGPGGSFQRSLDVLIAGWERLQAERAAVSR